MNIKIIHKHHICMENKVLKGSLTLIFSGLICKILGGIFRLPLTNILGVNGIGFYQLAMSLYSFVLILCCGGTTITLSKLVAETKNKSPERVNSLFKISLVTSLFLGFIIGLLFFIFGKKIAILQGGDFGNCYKLLILLLPIGGILATMRGILQGFEDMNSTAISQIIEQFGKFIFGLLLAYYFSLKNIENGVYGAFLGIIISELLSLIYLVFVIKKRKIKIIGKNYSGFYKNLFPILLITSVLPLTNAIDSLIIVKRLIVGGFSSSESVFLYGIQNGVVGTILNIPAIISASLATALLPSISSLENNFIEQKQRICTAFKFLWIVLLPMILGIMAICEPLYSFIYPNLNGQAISIAVRLTLIGGISSILNGIMQFMVVILQAGKRLGNLLFLEIIGGFFKIMIVYKFCAISEINVYGVFYGNIIMASIVIIGCLIELNEIVEIDFKHLILPLIASGFMFLCVKNFVEISKFSNICTILLSIVLGCLIYGLLVLPFLKKKFKLKNKKVKNKFIN